MTGGAGFNLVGYLAKRNNESVFDLATSFADALRKLLAVHIAPRTDQFIPQHTDVSPSDANVSTDNIIEFTVNTIYW